MYLLLECGVCESKNYLLRGTGNVSHLTNIVLYKAIYESKKYSLLEIFWSFVPEIY